MMENQELKNQAVQEVNASEDPIEELDLEKLKAEIVEETSKAFKAEINELSETVNKLSQQLKRKQVLVKKAVEANSSEVSNFIPSKEDWFSDDIIKAVKQGTSFSLTGLKSK